MDILISSNVERILFDKFGSCRTLELMTNLKNSGIFELREDEVQKLQEDFCADYCNDEDTLKIIKDTADNGYILDPHTATAMKVYRDFSFDNPTIIYSTAEWTKFAPTMAKAIFGLDLSDKDAIDMMKSKYNIDVVEQILSLFSKEIVQDLVIDKSDIASQIIKFINNS
jgi:threonine synthase